MNNQRVSVVITTYLRDDILAESLQSLAAQTLPLHEVLVVDDGGSGSAREIVTQFGERFRYCRRRGQLCTFGNPPAVHL